MILYVDVTVDEFEREGAIGRSATLERLLLCYRRGHHLVIINRPLINWLLQSGQVSAVGVSLLNRLSSEYTQTGALLQRADIVLTLRTSSCLRPARRNEVVVTFEEFESFELSDPATLLLENSINDGDLFRYILDSEAKRHGIGRLAIRLAHGGGADTLNQFRRLVEERRAAFCVIDRDTPGPFSGIGSKVQAFERFISEISWELAGFAVTPGREAENILPHTVLQVLQCWHGQCSRAFLLTLMEAGPDEFGLQGFWLNFDIKRGLTAGEWEALGEEERERVLRCLRRAGRTEFVVIEGFGDPVIQAWARHPRGRSLLAAAMRQQTWRAAFEHFFRLILWYFVAVPRRLI